MPQERHGRAASTSAHAAQQGLGGLLLGADRGELSDGAAEVADRRAEGEAGVVREVLAEGAGEESDLAEELVDDLVGRAGVEPHRQHLPGGMGPAGGG